MKYVLLTTYFLIWCAIVGLMLLAGCGSHTPSAPVIPPAISVTTLDQLQAALATAAAKPNTHILVGADITDTAPGILIQGNGTDLDLGGHTIGYTRSYDGTSGGCGFYVTPTFGPTAAYAGKNAAGLLLCNPAGSVQAIETALGGSLGTAAAPEFHEPAPAQYGGEALRDAYTQQKTILVPATNITIHDGRLATQNVQAFAVLMVASAKNVTVDGIMFDYTDRAPAGQTVTVPPNTGAQESEGVTFSNCDFGTWSCQFNSSYNCTVTACRNGEVSMEERCQKITVTKCTCNNIFVADATCGDVTISGNTLQNNIDGNGAMPLREIGGTSVVTGNTLLDGGKSGGSMWIGYLSPAGKLTVTGNKGGGFTRYGATATNAGIVDKSNSWDSPATQGAK